MIYEKASPNRLTFFFVYVTGIVTTRFPPPGKEWIMGNAKASYSEVSPVDSFMPPLVSGKSSTGSGWAECFLSIGYQRVSDRG
jgi:hypothetical protein